jgi:hypothetical protein
MAAAAFQWAASTAAAEWAVVEWAAADSMAGEWVGAAVIAKLRTLI